MRSGQDRWYEVSGSMLEMEIRFVSLAVEPTRVRCSPVRSSRMLVDIAMSVPETGR
jgi:hypothetical protein